MTTHIYVLKHPTTQEIRYIGQALKLSKRLERHLETARDLTNTRHISNWIRTLDSKPIMEVIEVCDVSICNEREKYWILYYKEKGCNLCNHSNGGEGAGFGNKNCLGRVLSDTTKEKLRQAAKQSRKTQHIESQKIYNSLKEACKDLNISYVNEFMKLKRSTSKTFVYLL